MEEQVQAYIGKLIAIRASQHTTTNFFDDFIELCEKYYSRPVNSLTEMRIRNSTKVKGDIFEHFARLYFIYCYKLEQVWLLCDVPEQVREFLSLGKNDVGIDLIGIDSNGKYYAIQAKYRKKGKKLKTGISWKQLSTFYGLVAKTGPYQRHIVITNADYVRHIGKKTFKDKSICLRTLRKITFEQWAAMTGHKGTKLDSHSLKSPDQEELRQARLAYFCNSSPIDLKK